MKEKQYNNLKKQSNNKFQLLQTVNMVIQKLIVSFKFTSMYKVRLNINSFLIRSTSSVVDNMYASIEKKADHSTSTFVSGRLYLN